MTTEKVFSQTTKKFLVLAALAVFVGHRLAEGLPSSGWHWPSVVVPASPTVSYDQLTQAQKALWQTVAGIRAADRKVLGDFHAGLARAVAADPASDPCIADTPAFRRAYRAGLLFVWAGVAQNQAGKYPGLSDAMEAALTEAIGKDEVIINPAIRQSVVAYLNTVVAICQSAKL